MIIFGVLFSSIAPSHVLTMTLEWLLTTQTLTTFDLYCSWIGGGEDRSICRLLSRVFGQNKSLANFHFPVLSIDVEDMDMLVNGLILNKTMTCIDFRPCRLAKNAWNCLPRVLLQDSPNTISISSIQLRSDRANAFKSCLRNLPCMAGIKKVEISTDLDAEGENLLLHAIKEKYTLLSFTTRDDQILNCTNVRRVFGQSFWPEWRATQKTWMRCAVFLS